MEHESKVVAILGEWRRRRDEGEFLDPEDVIRDHPELADELRKRFAIMDAVDRSFEAQTPDGVPTHISEYRIIREIGRGGMGVVYEAEQERMRRKVALKVLSLAITGTPQAVTRFRREAQAAGRLHHTNIVPVHDLDQHAGYWFYAMELVEGRPLSEIIAAMRDPVQPQTEITLARSAVAQTPGAAPGSTGTGARSYYVRIAEMFAGVAEGLELAHSQGIVHRDIKPSNLLLATDGQLKIVDFGLARCAGESVAMTRTGDLLGTPAYMSPEQAMAKRIRIDHRTDVYSLGATLYEAITQSRPFDGTDLPELCSQIITKDPVLPRKRNDRIPRDLETVVLKAMEKDRDKRYQQAGAFARDLWRFADGAAIQAKRIGLAGRSWRKVKRHKVRSALAACVLVALLLGAVAWNRARREEARRADLQYIALCVRAQDHPEDWERAEEDVVRCLGRAIALLPNRPEAYFWRALVGSRALRERMNDLDAAERRGLPPRVAHLVRAWFLASAGQPEKAQRETNLAAQFDERRPEDAYFEACVHAHCGRLERALKHLDRSLSGTGEALAIRQLALVLHAQLSERTGNYEAALQDVHALESLWPSVGHRVHAAYLWRRTGRLSYGEQLFEGILAELEREGDEDAWQEVVRTCAEAREFAWTLRAADRGLRRHADSTFLLIRGARGVMRKGELDTALGWIERAWRLDPGPACGAVRASILLKLGREPDAWAAWREAIVGGGTPGAIATWSDALNSVGRFEGALSVAREGVAAFPHNSELMVRLGGALNNAGRFDEALDVSGRCIAFDPVSAQSYGNRAVALCSLGRLEEALIAADTALSLDAALPNALYYRSVVLAEFGHYRDALRDADRAIALDPHLRGSLSARARALERLGRKEEAIKQHAAAVRLAPTWHGGWISMGWALVRVGRFDEALSAFEEALGLLQTHETPPPTETPKALAGRARALIGLERNEEAVDCLTRAIGLWPDSARRQDLARISCNRGSALARLGRDDEATADYRRALEAWPNYEIARLNLASALIKSGAVEEGIEVCRTGTKLHPRREEFHVWLAHALGKAGRWRELREVLEVGLLALPESVVLMGQSAWFLATSPLVDLREPARAVELARKTVELTPADRAHWNTLAVALYRAGELEQALDAFGRSGELGNGGDAYDWFFVAIAKHKLKQGGAKKTYERAVAWMDKNKPDDEELKRFRAEAEEVLGIKAE